CPHLPHVLPSSPTRRSSDLWYINALAALGRREEARDLFETVLACRNRHGLLAEHIDPRTREQWGNFVQTYSMVGLIGSDRSRARSEEHTSELQSRGHLVCRL